MQHYTDRLAGCKLDKNTSPPVRQFATRDALFRAAVTRLGRRGASVARTAAELLYWSQFAEHRLKGRKGIYKEDIELGDCLGMHPKTAGRHVLALCASAPENPAAATDQRSTLFDAAYGPKPKASSGRVRWLFIRPEGQKIIDEALQSTRPRRKRSAPADHRYELRPIGSRQSDRSPQNAPTHITQEDCADRRAEVLSKSSAKGEPENIDHKTKEQQGEVTRLVQRWRKVCEGSNRHDLVWRDQELGRWSDDLAELVAALRLHEVSDVDLEARLTVLCTDLSSLYDDMSEAFVKFNRQGLRLSTFAKYGTKLMKLAADRTSKPKDAGFRARSASEIFAAIEAADAALPKVERERKMPPWIWDDDVPEHVREIYRRLG